jgi:hypothetical protein
MPSIHAHKYFKAIIDKILVLSEKKSSKETKILYGTNIQKAYRS